MLRAKKYLGQHFLHDENIARKIIGSLNPSIPRVLEIGPGKGVLSKYLLDNPAFDPWFIEIDPEAVVYLTEKYPAIGNRIINDDFLHFDLSTLTTPMDCRCDPEYSGDATTANSFVIAIPSTREKQHQPSTIQILGNFPYNISSQILFRVLEYRNVVTELVGMFQKEVAQRLASPPGSKNYGILSVLIQAFYDVTLLFTVNETVFVPPPKVKSAVIRLRRNETACLACSEQLWMKVVKTAFNQRRKTLRNALKRPGIPTPASWEDPLFDLRAEQLSGQDFVRLTGILQGTFQEIS